MTRSLHFALAGAIALASLAATPPKARPRAAARPVPARVLTAAPFTLECEQEETMKIVANNEEPVESYFFQLVRFSIDPVAKRAVIDATTADGKSASAVRDLLSVTPDLILLCQADACLKTIPNGSMQQTFGLTRIDLKTMKLTRRVDSSMGDPASRQYTVGSVDRVSDCRVV